MHDVGQRVGIIDSGWDFAFAKLFYNIRYSGMCKNQDFLRVWMRKLVCGRVRKINFTVIKILQSGQTPLINCMHYRVA